MQAALACAPKPDKVAAPRGVLVIRLFQPWLAGAALLSALELFCGLANAQEMRMLPLQQEGQASVTVDELSRTAFVVDLGKSGGGDKVLINNKPLLEFLSVEKKVENFVIACSHPHADHMGGIVRDVAASLAAQTKSASVRTRMTTLAKSWKLKAKTLTALDEGILDDE